MTAKPTLPPVETAAGRFPAEPLRPVATALKPDMIVVKKSGDTEFVGQINLMHEDENGEVRMLVKGIAPGARKIYHICRPDQFRQATVDEVTKIYQMTAIWDDLAPTRAGLAEIQPGRFPEMGGDHFPNAADLDPFGTGGDPRDKRNHDPRTITTMQSLANVRADSPVPPPKRDDPEFMPAWAHKALIAIVAIGAAFCAVMAWQSLAAINAALAPV